MCRGAALGFKSVPFNKVCDRELRLRTRSFLRESRECTAESRPGNTPFHRSGTDNDPLERSNNSRSTLRGHRARAGLRKRVNGEVNDGEVLINGSTMGVEFAGFGEA